MRSAHFSRACWIVAVSTAMSCATSRADVIVYKEACGHNAFENWNLTCKVDRNSFAPDDSDFRTAAFQDIKSVTICASFNNGGRLNVPATIVHNYNDGRQSKPTELFDTVKFQGGLTANRVTWAGTGLRLSPSESQAWNMKAILLQSTRQNSFTYTETLLNGSHPIGEIRATCKPIADE